MKPMGLGGGRGYGRGGGIRPRRIRRFLEPALLLLLHSGPNHGYGLVEELKGLGLESYPTDISAVYRVLYDMEAQGLLASQQETAQSAGPPRRVYALTAEGDVYLQSWVQDLRETDRILHRFLAAYDAHRAQHAGDIVAETAETQPNDREERDR